MSDDLKKMPQNVLYYETLGVSTKATSTEIKKAYRELALKWLPHKHSANYENAAITFKKLANAYEVLSDTKNRQLYDNKLGNWTLVPTAFKNPEYIFAVEFFGLEMAQNTYAATKPQLVQRKSL